MTPGQLHIFLDGLVIATSKLSVRVVVFYL